MKHDPDESGIIVYDMHDDYSVGASSKSKKSADKGGTKDVAAPDLENGVTGSTAHLGSLTGRVYDKLTYRTIEGAQVIIKKGLSIKTDERGVFLAAHIKPGAYRVTVSEDGYVVQSRKSTVVAGETTQLESFHLIPDCLAAEYPDAIAEGEEESLEEEPIEEQEPEPSQEPVVMSSSGEIPATPAASVDARIEEIAVEEIMLEELSEETTVTGSFSVIFEDIENEPVIDSEITESITEEKPIECSAIDISEEAFSALDATVEEMASGDTIIAPVEATQEELVDETVSISVEIIQTSAIVVDSAKAGMSASEETVVENVSSVDEPAPVFVEIGIAEVAQPEEVSKELAGEEAQPKSSWRTWLKKKLKMEVLEEEHSDPPVEVVPEADTREVIAEEAHKEEISVDVTLEETLIPAIATDAAEASIPKSEERIAEDISSVDELPGAPTETNITEAIQFEEVSKDIPQEPVIEKTPVDIALEKMALEEVREYVPQDELIEFHIEAAAEITTQVMVVEEIHVQALLEPSVEGTSEITAQEEVLESVKKETPSEPFMEATSEITNQEIASDKANKEESFADVSASDEAVSISIDEIHAPPIAVYSTGAAISVFEERIVGDILSIDELSPLPVATDITETAQPEMFLGNVPEETPQELSLEETQIELAETEIAEEAAVKSVPIAKYEEPSLEPPVNIVSDTTALEISQPQEISDDVLQEPPGEEQQLKLQWWKLRKRKQKDTQPEGLAVDTSVVKTQTPVVAAEPTAALTFTSEEKTVVSEESSAEEQPFKPSLSAAVEQTGPLPAHPKQPSVSSPEAAPETTAQKKIAGSTQEEEEPIELAIEEIIKSSTADPALDQILTEIDKQTASIHAVTAAEGEGEVNKTGTKGQPVEVTDDAFASLSDEEKAAMLDDHDTVEVAGFVGIINAQPNPAYKGLPISIAYALKNLACDDPGDFMLRIKVTNPDTCAIHETFEAKVACIKGTFSMGGFVIFTTSYETSMYRLTMQLVSEKTKTSHPLTDIPLEIKSIF